MWINLSPPDSICKFLNSTYSKTLPSGPYTFPLLGSWLKWQWRLTWDSTNKIKTFELRCFHSVQKSGLSLINLQHILFYRSRFQCITVRPYFKKDNRQDFTRNWKVYSWENSSKSLYYFHLIFFNTLLSNISLKKKNGNK